MPWLFHSKGNEYAEHDGAKLRVGQILSSEPGEDFYEAKLTVLSEEIEHHVHEEEMPKKGMFAQARASDVDLVALGAAMMSRRQELQAQFKTSGIPIPTARTLKPIEIQLGEPVGSSHSSTMSTALMMA